MADISAKTWSNAGVSAINIHGNDNINKTILKFLCISDIAKKWGCNTIDDLIDKEIKWKYMVNNLNELTKPQIKKYKIDQSRFLKGNEHSM